MKSSKLRMIPSTLSLRVKVFDQVADFFGVALDAGKCSFSSV